MNRKSLLIGALVGFLIASVSFALFYFRSRSASTEPAAEASEPSPHGQHPKPASRADVPTASTGTSDSPTTVELTEEEQKTAGIQIAKVVRRNVSAALITPGRVEEAETQLATISARVGGRIDKLYVDFTGESVRRGQAIALIYSPEVVAAAEEYKLALESLERLGPDALATAQQQAKELVDASRRRLELWGLTAQQISGIAKSEQPQIHITIYSPVSGTVTERKVTGGQYVKEGDPLYLVADLSTVWVKADVYEADVPHIRPNQPVEISAESMPERKLRGRVGFIEPMLNEQTRTVAVRMQVPNPGLRLRPGMFVTATLQPSVASHQLAVPRTAVVRGGTKDIVYVAKGNGMFEGREVKLGAAGQDYYAVLSGLKEGEGVVTQGNFLLDSQSRLTGGLTDLFGGSKEFERTQEPAKPGEPAGQYNITFRSEPDPPKGGAENNFHVTVHDAQGKPVSDAQVRLALVMPAMPSMGMPEMRSGIELQWNGSEYVGTGNISMAGPWTVTVEVMRGGRTIATHRARVSAR
ncbi:MAG: efflux RND transporter periplasmic adaptor subunit [Acidobacteriales bacterium]|nr:efflux RND transporter periplasmic adaptor subunit [Terriglobales bacterium]